MEVIATTPFIRSAKPLAKKYCGFNADYQDFVFNHLLSTGDNINGVKALIKNNRIC